LTLSEVKILLDKEVQTRNNGFELSPDKPDPLLIAKTYNDESIALICALFAYGNAGQIVKFLESLDFTLLESSDEKIMRSLSSHIIVFKNLKM